MERREEILQGILSFPKQFIKILQLEEDINRQQLVKEFWDHLWYNFLQEKPVDSLTWYETFNNKMFFNIMLMHFSKAGWITSTVDNNYAWIMLNESKLMKWVSKEEIQNIRFRHKMEKYRFRKTKSVLSTVVQLNNRHEETGLVRKGFCKAGNNQFQYDTSVLKKYLKPVAENLKKGLTATNRDISYQEIIDELTDWYSCNYYDYYTLGNNISDSRGRSIFQCTKKLLNPVSSKDARALIEIEPQELTTAGFKAIYAFIAELLGYRGENIDDKINYGQSAYITRELPSLADMENSRVYDDLHIRIWLERIYDNLDTYETTKKWHIPIEIDALASLVQFVGVLTNDHDYMDMTNLTNPEEFKDIWTRPYCSRKHVKKALTPILYGSSASPKELWDKAKLDYTTRQVNEITRDLAIGLYRNAREFKDFIIDNVQPQPKMNVHIWNDKFHIECNRFKTEETKQVVYSIYTSSQGQIKRVTRSVCRVPDLNQFKRFFQTLLVHNLDSQVANHICENVDWIISNHDSFTIHPNDVPLVRSLYTGQLMDIYRNRREILRNYFRSIGITKEYPEKVNTQVKIFSGFCLK